MRKPLLFIIALFSVSFLFADENEVLLLPYNTTTLTPEQQAMNPTFVAYPTQLKNSIPQMKCNSELFGFTIDAQGRKVVFSPGNLQYNAAKGTHHCADGTTQPGTWRFAEHQWDYVGDATNGNVYENGVKCNNELISSNYNGWIDLYAWGTSGWPRVTVEDYLPYSSSEVRGYPYYINGDGLANLDGTNADWGVYNQIGSDPTGTWSTLSKEQWNYLINTRPNSANLCGFGTVNGVDGCILLPDNWQDIPGINFTPSKTYAAYNFYTLEQWQDMENHGAVFLPQAGLRNGTQVDDCNSTGYYWTTTTDNSYYMENSKKVYTDAHDFLFHSSLTFSTLYRYMGASVRLVRIVEE